MKRLAALLLLAACGAEESISVRGDFARAGDAPARVYAREARAEAPVRDGAFRLDGLATSPISLRLIQNGDTVASLDLAGLPPGARLVLHSLRVDRATRRAFPGSIELTGAQTVTVNGLRMAAALPARVDAEGTILSAARDGSALLVRPTDASLPDLRVVTSPATAGTSPAALVPGRSVRVTGETERGYVVADRVEVR